MKGGDEMEGLRPVQIQLEEKVFRELKVYAAGRGITANELIAGLARQEAERVRDKVAAILE